MRLSLSNLAWDPVFDEAVAGELVRRGIDAIDVAPGKYFPDPSGATTAEIERVREAWSRRGVDVVGLQGLLFGAAGLQVFGPAAVQERTLGRLAAVCRIAEGLGAGRLVFGSFRNRDRGELSPDQAIDASADFFRRFGDIAAMHGLVVGLEPVPARYGANFMTTTAETVRVVEVVAHPAIRLQFDTGAIAVAGEDAGRILEQWGDLVGHVHVSEPDLVPLGDADSDHEHLAALLRRRLPDAIATVELLTNDADPLAAIRRALDTATRHYRADQVTAA